MLCCLCLEILYNYIFEFLCFISEAPRGSTAWPPSRCLPHSLGPGPGHSSPLLHQGYPTWHLGPARQRPPPLWVGRDKDVLQSEAGASHSTPIRHEYDPAQRMQSLGDLWVICLLWGWGHGHGKGRLISPPHWENWVFSFCKLYSWPCSHPLKTRVSLCQPEILGTALQHLQKLNWTLTLVRAIQWTLGLTLPSTIMHRRRPAGQHRGVSHMGLGAKGTWRDQPGQEGSTCAQGGHTRVCIMWLGWLPGTYTCDGETSGLLFARLLGLGFFDLLVVLISCSETLLPGSPPTLLSWLSHSTAMPLASFRSSCFPARLWNVWAHDLLCFLHCALPVQSPGHHGARHCLCALLETLSQPRECRLYPLSKMQDKVLERVLKEKVFPFFHTLPLAMMAFIYLLFNVTLNKLIKILDYYMNFTIIFILHIANFKHKII